MESAWRPEAEELVRVKRRDAVADGRARKATRGEERSRRQKGCRLALINDCGKHHARILQESVRAQEIKGIACWNSKATGCFRANGLD
jgi:hypothetical protein